MRGLVVAPLLVGLFSAPAFASQDVEVVRLCLSTARYMEAVGQFAKMPNGSHDEDTAQRVGMAQADYLEDVEVFSIVAGSDARAVLAQLGAPLGESLGKAARCAKFGLCDASQADSLINLAGSLRNACRSDFEGAN